MSYIRLSGAVLAMALTGCLSWFEPTPPKPIDVFRSEAQTQEMEVGSLSLKVKMLLDEDIIADPALIREVPYSHVTSDGTVILKSTETWTLANPPVFEITLLNNGKRTFLFDRFNARLLVDSEVFDPSNPQMMYQVLSQRINNSSSSRVYDTSFINAGSLRLLNRKLELLPGIPQTAYLVFHAYNYLDINRSAVNAVTLKLFDVPVDTDEASGVARTEMVTFEFPLASQTIMPAAN